MRILLTGGSGFVGKNLLDILANEHEVEAPTRLQLNLQNREEVASWIRMKRPDLIIHCAGVVGGIGDSQRDASRFLVGNLDCGINIALGALTAGVNRLVNISTSCIYPYRLRRPLRESDVLNGHLEDQKEAYGLAKGVIVRLCHMLNLQYPGLEFKSLIPCNLYGKYDHYGAEDAHMVPAVMTRMHEAVHRQIPEITMWGDGTARREYLYAGDFAEFVSLAVSGFEKLPELLNVGTGDDYSVRDCYEAIAEVVGFKGAIIPDIKRSAGAKRRILDTSELTRSFRWKPRISLRDGLKQTYQDFLCWKAGI